MAVQARTCVLYQQQHAECKEGSTSVASLTAAPAAGLIAAEKAGLGTRSWWDSGGQHGFSYSPWQQLQQQRRVKCCYSKQAATAATGAGEVMAGDQSLLACCLLLLTATPTTTTPVPACRYVQCYDCGNPETMVKIKREFITLKCKACG